MTFTRITIDLYPKYKDDPEMKKSLKKNGSI